MRTEDTATDMIEPVTIEEVKGYLGYDQNNSRDDDLLNRLITGQRSMLEDVMGRIIVQRGFIAHPQTDGAVRLLPDLQEVSGISYKDRDGVAHDVEEYDVDLEYSVVCFAIDEEYEEISITYTSGFGIIPEVIKTAILDLVKAKYDRSSEDVLSAVRPSIQKYWSEHI